MAEVLREFRGHVSVSHGCFDVGDAGGWLLHGDSTCDGSVDAWPSWLRISCDISDGTAEVRMDVWDADPPPPDSPWVGAGEVRYLAGTGVIQLSDDDTIRDACFLLGPSYFLYGLRAYRVPPARERGHEFWEDPRAEHWLLRFWPIRDGYDPVVHGRSRHEERASGPAAVGYLPSTDWPTLRPRPEPHGTARPEPVRVDPPTKIEPHPWKEAVRAEGLRIAGELNPHMAPTFSISPRDLDVPGDVGVHPGLSGRVLPQAGAAPDMERLTSLIVTVLAEDDDLITVREATDAEAARVTAAERAWGPASR
ncbi:hypothetical protein [Microtetraspora malaysiensis]|uniref:hypothetical protein n=1 Tax=Microtetraspora malaysiensis TaxID=161358 RepID=UPI003D89C8A4